MRRLIIFVFYTFYYLLIHNFLFIPIRFVLQFLLMYKVDRQVALTAPSSATAGQTKAKKYKRIMMFEYLPRNIDKKSSLPRRVAYVQLGLNAT